MSTKEAEEMVRDETDETAPTQAGTVEIQYIPFLFYNSEFSPTPCE